MEMREDYHLGRELGCKPSLLLFSGRRVGLVGLQAPRLWSKKAGLVKSQDRDNDALSGLYPMDLGSGEFESDIKSLLNI